MLGKIVPKLVMGYMHRKYKPVPGPQMTSWDLNKMLRKYTDNVWISDAIYSTSRKKDIEQFLKYNVFRFREYVPEKYDCDNYSFALMGMFTYLLSGHAIGIVWVETPRGAHALNFFIDENKELWYIEPQTNAIFQTDDYSPYFIVL
jgi:hypothetical protein